MRASFAKANIRISGAVLMPASQEFGSRSPPAPARTTLRVFASDLLDPIRAGGRGAFAKNRAAVVAIGLGGGAERYVGLFVLLALFGPISKVKAVFSFWFF